VATVAMRAGFGDLSHFHAAFRRRYGATPAAWRRQAASA
jgi:AraC-like DNA-binding protein